MTAIQPLIGIIALLALAWAISVNRRAFPWRVVAVGLALQFALAVMLLKAPGSQLAFAWIGDGVNALMSATEAGTSFVFGFLGGAPLPFDETSPGGSVVFAFRILPLVILISALSAVLYHYRVLPWIVFGFAWVLGKTLRISGASSFATAANVFIGMVESPLLVRPYLARMTRSELFMMMTAGMATIAGHSLRRVRQLPVRHNLRPRRTPAHRVHNQRARRRGDRADYDAAGRHGRTPRQG